MSIRRTPLLPTVYYHIYNRGINGRSVFFEEKNYDYFLNRYYTYVHPYAETYAYCLLKNHFHFLIRVRGEEELAEVITRNHHRSLTWHTSNALASWMQSYTRGVNKVYCRTGALFEAPFKRKIVDNEFYFSRLIAYIHQNPQKHGIIRDFRDYPHSSFRAYVSKSLPSVIKRDEVFDWFGGEVPFHKFHQMGDEIRISTEDLKWMIE